MTKICQFCGREFEPDPDAFAPEKVKYCNAWHRYEHEKLKARERYYKKNNRPIPPKVRYCRICGKELPTHRGVCCSKECAVENNRREVRRRARLKRKFMEVF